MLQMSYSRLMRLSNDDGERPPPCVEDGSLTLKSLASNSSLSPGGYYYQKSNLLVIQAQPIFSEEVDNLIFSSLELDVLESCVTDKPANVFDEARPIFLNAKDWLEKAKEYYTMEHHASDAVEIIQDTSRLYQSLIFFEEDEDR